MKRKVVVLFLCIVLVLMSLAGCSGSSGNDASVSKVNTGESTVKDKEAKEGTEEETKEEATTVLDDWKWPLSDKKELSIWIVWENEYVETPNDLKAIQKIEENTNVHVNWSYIAAAEAAEKFSLMIASGEYPDIIRGAETYYTGGLTKMVDDGVSIELTDLVEKNMPNYSSLRKSNDKLLRDTMTDDSRLCALYTLASNAGNLAGERVWGGPAIRQDWLDEVGMKVPVTINDWHEALSAIKAKHPECESPLMLGKAGTNFYGAFTSAFGILPEYYNNNGTVKYGPLEPGYKQWVETFRQWYKEGLIDPNFVSNDASVFDKGEFMGSGKAAASPMIWGLTANVFTSMGYNKEEKFWLSATTYPVMNNGDTPQAGAPMSELVKETTVITSACKDVELAMRYLDYYYSKEGMMLDSLGIEGESYIDKGDGTFSITDTLKSKITDGTYPTVAAAVYTYSLGTSAFGLYNWAMFNAIYEGNPAVAAYDVWENTKYDLMLPPCMTMTEDEAQEYASIYTSIQTLVQENTVKFIMGTQSMDEYDRFVEELSTYGISRCIELKQAALDRYYARGN